MKSPGAPVDIVKLANSTVFHSTGQQLRLGQVWQKQTVVLIFLRHFACIACRAHVSQVWNDREKYERSGAKIAFVGNGQPNFIEKFREDLGLKNAFILTDPSLNSFQAAGFKRGFFKLIQPRSVANFAKLALDGHTQAPYSKEAGTHWQMGGVIVINPKGQVLYHYISEALGDFPEEPHIDLIEKDEEEGRSA